MLYPTKLPVVRRERMLQGGGASRRRGVLTALDRHVLARLAGKVPRRAGRPDLEAAAVALGWAFAPYHYPVGGVAVGKMLS